MSSLRLQTISGLFVALGLAAAASAAQIDFEAQAVGAGSTLTGNPNLPLIISGITFSGGEILTGELGLVADQTAVYSTAGLIGAGLDSNPLVISFSAPVSNFSLLLANGDAQNTSYIISDNLGDSVNVTLALAGSLGTTAQTVAVAGNGITSVSIRSANSLFWNFAIDNVTSSPATAPEPPTFCVALGGLAFAGCLNVLKRSFA